MSDKDEELEPEVFIESVSNIRYLVVRDGDRVARQRIPLHIWNMPDSKAKVWFMREFITKVKRKMFKLKHKGQIMGQLVHMRKKA